MQRVIDSWPKWVFVLSVPFLTLLHSGFNYSFNRDTVQSATVSFPSPMQSQESTSYGLRTIAWAFGVTTEQSYLKLSFALTLIVMLAFGFYAWSKLPRNAAAVVVAIVLIGPIGTNLVNNIGMYDVFMYAGALFLGIAGRSWLTGIVGGLLMSAGNPEQALLASIAFALVGIGLTQKNIWKAGIAAFITALISWAFLFAYVRSSGTESRIFMLTRLFRQSLSYFLQGIPIQIYAGYGLAFAFVLVAVTALSRNRAILLLIGILVLPVMATASTLDQTRVLVQVSTASVVALLVWIAPRALIALERIGWKSASALIVCIAVVLPAVSIIYPGEIRLPYRTAVELYFNPAAGGQ